MSKTRKIAVYGAGYVGLTTAIGLASLGHEVTCVDVNPDRVASLKRGDVPIAEPLIPDLLKKFLRKGKVQFVTQLVLGDREFEFAFVCVNTPQLADGSADLSSVVVASQAALLHLQPDGLVVIKSTVPPGTCRQIQDILGPKVGVVSNPEFLRQGSAMRDFLNPDRVVIGSSSSGDSHRVLSLFAKLSPKAILTDTTSSEIAKYAANAMLASRISFVNEIAEFCEAAGASVSHVLSALALDPRVGSKFLKPGPGWGGACFPKDVAALQSEAKNHRLTLPLIESISKSNTATQSRITNKILLLNPKGNKHIGVWGLTAKAGTDELRDSPAIAIVTKLAELGYSVLAYDPAVDQKTSLPFASLKIASSPGEVLEKSRLLIVLTEWAAFSEFRPSWNQAVDVKVLDTRGVLSKEIWREKGVNVHQFGERSPS